MSPNPPLNIFTLPLFPLNSVLFPHFLLQLHVFEERYKVMINGCIERSEPFGVVLIKEGSEVGTPAVPYEVGCMARILAVKRLEDERMYLFAVGESRFRLLDYVEADYPYLLGRVETIEEIPTETARLQSQTQEAAELFLRYLTLLAQRANLPMPEVELPDDPTLLTFYIASVVQMAQEGKQKLLEMTDTPARLQLERDLLRAQVEELEALRVRQNLPEPDSGSTIVTPLDSDSERLEQYRALHRN